MGYDAPRPVWTSSSLTTTHLKTRGKGIMRERRVARRRGARERTCTGGATTPPPSILMLSSTPPLWPQPVRLCSSVLDRRPRGENGTCPSCVAMTFLMAVKCASVGL
jgi:hypothetical protein